MYLLSFSKQIWWLFTILNEKSLNPAFKIGFLVQNNPWNLWGQLENSEWILCGRKTGCQMWVFKISETKYIFTYE